MERWYEQETESKVIEAFWPGKHISYAQLERDRLKDESDATKLPSSALKRAHSSIPYTCITDGELLKSLRGYNSNLEFPISTIRHLTEQSVAESIFKEGGFRSGEKDIRTIWSDQRYSWWSVHYEENGPFSKIAHERAALIQRELEKDPDSCYPRVVPSFPFLDTGFRDGHHAFTYDIHDMMEAYRDQFCEDEDEDLVVRILGTFVYLQQIMHAVLVHSSEYNYIFGHLPLVSGQTADNRIYQSSSGELFWSPESIIRREDEPFSPWERLCFAFHMPKYDSVLKLDDPRGHCTLIELILSKSGSTRQMGTSSQKLQPVTANEAVV